MGRPIPIAMSLSRLNRFASLAILPLMALVIAFAWRAQSSEVEAAPRPVEGTLVVANLRADSLSFIDLTHEEPRVRTLAVPGPAHELALLGEHLYVTLGRGDRLLAVNPRAPGILRVVEFPGDTPHGLAVAPGRVLVSHDKANRVDELDVFTLEPLRSWPTGDTPHALAAAGSEVYVTDARDARLRLLGDPPALTTTSGLPESVAIVGDRVVTADADGRTLSVFERRTLAPLHRIELAGRPVRVVSLDASRVVVSLSDTGEVAVVDVSSGVIERRLAVGARPDGLCFDPSGEHLAVVSNADNRVDFFRVADWAPAGSLLTADGPGACIWMS